MVKVMLGTCVSVLVLVGGAQAAFVGGPDFDTSDAVTASAPNWEGTVAPPIHAVDGSGLDPTGEMHGTGSYPSETIWLGELDNRDKNDPGSYLWNPGTYFYEVDRGDGVMKGPNWIRFDLDQVYPIDYIRIWNDNEGISSRGMNEVVVEYSTTGGSNPAEWTRLGGPDAVQYFPQAPSEDSYTGFILDFPDVNVKHVVFTARTPDSGVACFSGAGNVGLSEVRFYIVPEPATIGLLGIGCLALLRRRRA